MPTSSTNAVIASSANNPTVDVAANTAGLVVNSGASITVPSGQSLTVNGDLVNNGNINVQNQGALLQADCFASSNWSLSQVGGANGSVTSLGSPNRIFFYGSDAVPTFSAYDYYEITIQVSGTISFDWSLQHFDSGYDDFGYRVNGVNTFVADQTGSGSVSLSVNAGDVFGFYAYADDGCCGTFIAEITNLVGPCFSTSGSGGYSVARTIPAGAGNAFRFMGSPISNASVSGFGVSPSGTNGAQLLSLSTCDPTQIDPASPYGNILELNEAAVSSNNCAQELWFVKSAGSLTNGRGYSVMTNDNVTHNFSGLVNNGRIVYPSLGRQAGTINLAAGGTSTRGWHLVSNPYPSPIALNVHNMPEGFDAQVQIWDAANSNWISINPLGTADIALGQAFQVRNSSIGSSRDFVFTNSMRHNGSPTFYSNPMDTLPYILLSLSTQAMQESHTIFFHPEATEAFDPTYDANRLFGNHQATYLHGQAINNEGIQEALSYNALPLQSLGTDSLEIPVFLKTLEQGTGMLEIELKNLPQDRPVYLRDETTQLNQQVTDGQVLQVNFQGPEDGHRFTLHFGEPFLGFENQVKNNLSAWSDGSQLRIFLNDPGLQGVYRWSLFAMDGRLVAQGEANNLGQSFIESQTSISNGVYIVQLTEPTGNMAQVKLIVSN